MLHNSGGLQGPPFLFNSKIAGPPGPRVISESDRCNEDIDCSLCSIHIPLQCCPKQTDLCSQCFDFKRSGGVTPQAQYVSPLLLSRSHSPLERGNEGVCNIADVHTPVRLREQDGGRVRRTSPLEEGNCCNASRYPRGREHPWRTASPEISGEFETYLGQVSSRY